MTGKIIKSNSFKSSQSYILKSEDKYKDDRDQVAWEVGRNLDYEDTTNAYKEVRDYNFSNNRIDNNYESVHIIISASPRDPHIPKEQWEEIADHTLKKLDLEKHTAVIARHNDKEYDHIHIVANYYDKEGKAFNPHGDYKKVHESMRDIEKKFGLEKNESVYSNREKSHKNIEQWEISKEKESNNEWKSISSKTNPLKEKLKEAQSYYEIDRLLSKEGLYLDKKGNGAVISDGYYSKSASKIDRDLSRANLEKKFNRPLKDYIKEREAIVPQKDIQEMRDAFRNSVLLKDKLERKKALNKKVENLEKQFNNLKPDHLRIKQNDKDVRRMIDRYFKGDPDLRIKQMRKDYHTQSIEKTISQYKLISTNSTESQASIFNKHFNNKFKNLSEKGRDQILSDIQNKVIENEQIKSRLPRKFTRLTTQERDSYLSNLEENISKGKVADKKMEQAGISESHYQSSINALRKMKNSMDSEDQQSQEQKDMGKIYTKGMSLYNKFNSFKNSIKLINDLSKQNRILKKELSKKKNLVSVIGKYQKSVDRFNKKTDHIMIKKTEAINYLRTNNKPLNYDRGELNIRKLNDSEILRKPPFKLANGSSQKEYSNLNQTKNIINNSLNLSDRDVQTESPNISVSRDSDIRSLNRQLYIDSGSGKEIDNEIEKLRVAQREYEISIKSYLEKKGGNIIDIQEALNKKLKNIESEYEKNLKITEKKKLDNQELLKSQGKSDQLNLTFRYDYTQKVSGDGENTPYLSDKSGYNLESLENLSNQKTIDFKRDYNIERTGSPIPLKKLSVLTESYETNMKVLSSQIYINSLYDKDIKKFKNDFTRSIRKHDLEVSRLNVASSNSISELARNHASKSQDYISKLKGSDDQSFGTVVDYGYKHQKGSNLSYFVRLRSDNGNEYEIWNKNLDSDIEGKGIGTGDKIKIHHVNSYTENISIPEKDNDGNIIRDSNGKPNFKPKEVQRQNFSIQREGFKIKDELELSNQLSSNSIALSGNANLKQLANADEIKADFNPSKVYAEKLQNLGYSEIDIKNLREYERAYDELKTNVESTLPSSVKNNLSDTELEELISDKTEIIKNNIGKRVLNDSEATDIAMNYNQLNTTNPNNAIKVQDLKISIKRFSVASDNHRPLVEIIKDNKTNLESAIYQSQRSITSPDDMNMIRRKINSSQDKNIINLENLKISNRKSPNIKLELERGKKANSIIETSIKKGETPKIAISNLRKSGIQMSKSEFNNISKHYSTYQNDLHKHDYRVKSTLKDMMSNSGRVNTLEATNNSIDKLERKISKNKTEIKNIGSRELFNSARNALRNVVSKNSPEFAQAVQAVDTIKRSVKLAKTVGNLATEPISGGLKLAKESFSMVKKQLMKGSDTEKYTDKGIEMSQNSGLER
jgi:hypothetical protein